MTQTITTCFIWSIWENQDAQNHRVKTNNRNNYMIVPWTIPAKSRTRLSDFHSLTHSNDFMREREILIHEWIDMLSSFL